ncbi:D-alanyl-D-alanine carboxypeptidase/D-alanyl-D-alanine endopeptidase [Rhodovulum adriaticum]|uniref:D-alanyl-D-alanine carboxypeptidase/D-alanyl-D-alanine-endopeptidase (Penicillin-binding protein 4) n=1 Tax=Rhodovulum adriaticum TaxID=35804 RepID=A0A4R2NIE0_RHOAD|nr:D-alanyl-D-alanine carboxypeptidase/D-alanyl-D-alanine-endopeptidase [Rhodovulum adriaticum]MBK1635422.1 D-alanyl-D-alanine carboxypeptidase/D-alanyl-D-alanine-endopeptidase [Rhodovulum adriaticum]TCP21130.1 D-alanyl-D-alanine carboxypeptidase/D-alanyl-D-alanine-endopeptidase (penicillin-binding protein 4) [Rhodovulum adriaticum]
MKGPAIPLSRRAFLAAATASVASEALATPLARSPRPVARPELARRAVALDRLLADARLSGKIGLAVADARTGEMLEVHNPLLGLPPASVTKAGTAFYALEALGPDHRFETRVIATGPVRSGRIQGDLVLVGGGDPTLDTDMLGDLVAKLTAAGIRGVTGRFLYHSGALPELAAIDPGQPDHAGYNPAISGLNLNFNRVHFEWRRNGTGYAVTMDARARRYRPEVGVARMRVVQRAAPVYTYSSMGGVDEWTVAQGALGNGGARWLPVRRPALYCAEVFHTLARAQGLRLPDPRPAPAPPRGALLAHHLSAPLSEILRAMLKYSTNLTAETVGLAATLARGGQPTGLAASGQAMTEWIAARVGTRRARFVDHSGLSDASRISAAEMVRLLVAVGPDGPLNPLMKDIPIRDANGKVMSGHPVKVRAKTGTLNFVSALAGYATGPDGRDLAFAIFTADEDRRARLTVAQRDRPPGGRAWIGRSRTLQRALVARWGLLYG